jgi:hypothetical protein
MRVVVGLSADQQPEPLADELRSRGASHVQGPVPALPGVLIADFPEGDLATKVKEVAQLSGVRYAEPDEMQTIA